MRVVFLTDRSFAARERAMLSRLEVALTQEGVGVVRAWPGSAPAGAPRTAFAPAIAYADRGPLFTLRSRASDLAEAIRALPGAGEGGADVIHAWGEERWPMALAVADELGASLALEVWSASAAAAADRLLRSRPGTTTAARVCFAPDEAMKDRLGRTMPASPVRLTTWGVHLPDQPREPLRGETATAVVIGSGEDGYACAAALGGLADACRKHESLIAFVDAAIIRRQRSLWKLVRKQGLAPRVSLVEGLEARRDLTLEADILIQPEALGQRRTITLDAMAHGMIVLARRDDEVSALRGEAPHALLIDRGDAPSWASALRRTLEDQPLVRRVSEAAREYVRSHRLASAHARAVLDAYEWMAGARSIPFPEAASA